MTPSVIVLSFIILLLFLGFLLLIKGAGDATAKHEADQWDGLHREGEDK